MQALSFLTSFGGAALPTPAAVAWFPVVGALLGLVLGALWLAAEAAWPPALAAAIVVGADLALTGILHFDGLVDSADGLLPPMERSHRLAAMSDPGVGAFGLAAGAGILLLRWTSVLALNPSPWLLAGLWAGARTVMALALWSGRPARPGGLTAAFAGGRRRSALLGAAALAGSAALVWAGRGAPGVLALAGGLLAGAGLLVLARQRIGGYTGDVLGAAGLVCETAALLLAAARW